MMKTAMLAILLGLWSVPAVAHSPLINTNPEDAEILAAAPAEIVMAFKGNIRLTRVTLAHAHATPQDLSLGDQTTFRQDYIIPLADMGAGEYLIAWRGLGDDGHPQSGTFAFMVE